MDFKRNIIFKDNDESYLKITQTQVTTLKTNNPCPQNHFILILVV